MTYDVWVGDRYLGLPVPQSGGEAVMTPNVNGVVFRASDPSQLLLQRRDKPEEAVRGRLELPGGRWRAGEPIEDALAREVMEEAGVEIVEVDGVGEPYRPNDRVGIVTIVPRVVIAGREGAYPSLHVVLSCRGEGVPRALPGETADPRWWDVEDVRRLLSGDPEAFVWHAHAMLTAVL